MSTKFWHATVPYNAVIRQFYSNGVNVIPSISHKIPNEMLFVGPIMRDGEKKLCQI